VNYTALTAEGLLREPVFKGIRDDLTDETRRPVARRSRLGAAAATSVPKENILQLLPDAVVPTREQLEAYWRKVPKRALKYLGQRPLKLIRHVRGTTFYHKGPLPAVPDAVRQLTVRKHEGGEGTRVWSSRPRSPCAS
jgi:bifunctional non-homologous end joining protein LigD